MTTLYGFNFNILLVLSPFVQTVRSLLIAVVDRCFLPTTSSLFLLSVTSFLVFIHVLPLSINSFLGLKFRRQNFNVDSFTNVSHCSYWLIDGFYASSVYKACMKEISFSSRFYKFNSFQLFKFVYQCYYLYVYLIRILIVRLKAELYVIIANSYSISNLGVSWRTE